MGRPEHVRCENCCYWDRSGSHGDYGGECIAGHPIPSRLVEDGEAWGIFPVMAGSAGCGEFRAEWPGEEWSLADWMSRHKEATSGGSPST